MTPRITPGTHPNSIDRMLFLGCNRTNQYREVHDLAAFHLASKGGVHFQAAKLTVRHTDKAISQQAAQRLAAELTDALGSNRVLGPEEPLVERIRNQFLFDILIKIEREKVNIKAVKIYIRDRIRNDGPQRHPDG